MNKNRNIEVKILKIGVSTACLYPSHPELALEKLIAEGFDCFEFFVNSFKEMEDDYLLNFKKQLDDSSSKVVSIHPFTSAMEAMFFFDGYDRRFEDGIEIYRKFFKTARFLGAKFFVLHGPVRNRNGIYSGTCEQYCEIFSKLSKVAKEYDVTLCQENVYSHRSASIEFIRNMVAVLGDEANFVFDIKQCIKQGEDPVQMIKAMGKNLKHVHISDNNDEDFCLIPGDGTCDFTKIYKALKEINYDNSVIIEVYGHSVKKIENLKDGKTYLSAIFM